MITPLNVYNQIKQLTEDLIRMALCDKQNFPSMKRCSGNVVEISVTNPAMSKFLRDEPYAYMYNELDKSSFYNVKMLDGALITFMYRFKDSKLTQHRLSFFPSPDLERYQEAAEEYKEMGIYLECISKSTVTVPIRFDYDVDAFVPVKHPISHLTLGQYEKCRIPVSSALSPYQFLEFILRNFYNTEYDNHSSELTCFRDVFDDSIVDEEKRLLNVCTQTFV